METGDNLITGVIEIPRMTQLKLECNKDEPYNPVMQDYHRRHTNGQMEHRVYIKPPDFNYGFIPQTWCDDMIGGDSDPLDLVDLSWKEIKPVLAVSDYLVLGLLGLVD